MNGFLNVTCYYVHSYIFIVFPTKYFAPVFVNQTGKTIFREVIVLKATRLESLRIYSHSLQNSSGKRLLSEKMSLP